MNKRPVIAIIGGGASGIISAIYASSINSKNLFDIIILERMNRIGKKILATGNGRCNITNINISSKNYYGNNPEFTNYALKEYSVQRTLEFFDKLGILAKEEQQGKIYPYSDQASAILDALRNELERLNIKIITEFEAKEIIKQKNGFKINSFNSNSIFAEKVIISSGGCASPNLGSNGTGFKIIKSLGHNVTALSPALVQLKTKPIFKNLKGIKLNGKITALINNKAEKEEYGEILFTDYGISGPPVFQLSTLVAQNKNIKISIDFMPQYSKSDIYNLLCKRKENLKHTTAEYFFTGMLNKRLGNTILKTTGIEKLSFNVAEFDHKILNKFSEIIKYMPFDIIGSNDWNNAQVTAGGADTSQFNEKTMESKIVKGLYACGEILDIYGDCGGYNLQWAWSSGYIAGINASKSLLNK